MYYKENKAKHKKLQEKMAYCSNNIKPLLNENKIAWNHEDPRVLIIKDKRFPIMSIDDGKAEAFIRTLIDEGGQSSLDYYQ